MANRRALVVFLVAAVRRSIAQAPVQQLPSRVGLIRVGQPGQYISCLNVSITNQGNLNHSVVGPGGNTNASKTCYENVKWAKDNFEHRKAWYPGLNANSTLYDFQWAIFNKSGPLNLSSGTGDGESWGCDLPCGKEDEALRLGLVTAVYAPTVTVTAAVSKAPTSAPTIEPSASFPPWAWALVGIVALATLIGCCVFFMGQGSKPKKSRAVKITKPVEQAPLIPVSTAQPMYYRPMQAPAQPVSYVQQPMSYATQPASYVQAPMSREPVQAQQAYPMDIASSLFDQLDRNHDGTISRAELQAALGRR